MKESNAESKNDGLTVEPLTALIARRACNLFETGQLMCSEAVLVVLNRGLQGGLPEGMDVRLAGGWSEGVGQAGCTCGALSGGIMALGLFLGRNRPGVRNNRKVLEASRELHDLFKGCFKATCCRVLTRDLIYGSQPHFKICARRTGETAELAAQLILDRHPGLIEHADRIYLARQDGTVGAGVRRLANLLRPT